MSPLSRAILALLLPAAASAQFCPLSAGDTIKKIVACKPGVSTALCREHAQSVGCSVVRELPLIGAIVIEVPAVREKVALAKLKANTDVNLVETDRKLKWLRAGPVTAMPAFEFPDAARDILRRIAELKPKAPAELAPGAPDPEQPWGIRRVNAQSAWTTPRGQGAGAVIAVIDTGVSRTHPDLIGQVIGGFNALEGAQPGAWEDDEGHGTHVAATIAGKRDKEGVVGVAPMAKIVAVKVLDADGGFSDVIAGIEWAASKGIKVANMSLGADEGSEALRRAVAAAAAKGMTIVAASGNSGGPVGFPAAYDEAIAVAASDEQDNVAIFSSRGPQVDFVAPGVKVKSARLGGGYVDLDGTSMATPHVAGLAALAVLKGATNPLAVRKALESAATPLPGAGRELQGAGMIDAAKLR